MCLIRQLSVHSIGAVSEMHLDEEREDADDPKLPLEPMWDPINRVSIL
jgi:hypothetical protein